ncbi:hypothetical protein LSCM1_04419 [Leishmania martiniquensis]|uniref:Sec16 Sec23-binding domain-containing protein n=1 Tax=Leishmania martiniquensis TaxID=1580590 RepID=A0A836GHI6_9TRYP|nr:hypothetical protein LSCM1_04419 [Leishmania martiniquensis]
MRSFVEQTEAGVPQEPVFPPAPSPLTPPVPLPSAADPTAVPLAPPLATRVSGAAITRPRGSSTSGNGRQSPGGPSEIAGHWAPRRNSEQLRSILAETKISGASTTAAGALHRSRPSSRGSSASASVAAGSTAGIDAGSGRTLLSPGHLSSSGSGLRRSVPTFLQPGGGDRVVPRPLRAASSGADSTASASRGRQLLEAALTSRGARHTPLRNTPLTSPSASPQQHLSASMNERQGTPISGREADAAAAGLRAEGYLGARGQPVPALAHSRSVRDRSAATGASSLAQELGTLQSSLASSGAEDSVPLRRAHQLTGGNEDPLTWNAALPANEQRGDPKDMKTWHSGLQQAGVPPRTSDVERGSHDSGADAASVDSHLSASPAHRNGRIGGDAAAPGANVYSAASTHQPCFGPSRALSTFAGESSQNALSAGEQEPRGVSTGDSDPPVAAVAHVNPFRAMPSKSGGGGIAAPPPLRSHAPDSGVQRSVPPSPNGSASAGKAPRVPLSCYPGADLSARERLSGPKATPAAEGAGEAGPSLPPLPQPGQQLPRFAPGGVDTATVAGPAMGFTTPRGGRAGSMPEAYQQKPQHLLPPSAPSTSNLLPNMSRDPYAASPYIRDEDVRAVDGGSPMPLRPAFCERVTQLLETQKGAAEQGDADFCAVNGGASSCTDGDLAVGRSMWDGPCEGGSAAGQHLRQPPRDQYAEPPHSAVHNEGTANPFSSMDTHIQVQRPLETQQRPPPPLTQELHEQERHQEGLADQAAHQVAQRCAYPPPTLSTRAIYDSSASRLLPDTASLRSKNLLEGNFNSGNRAELSRTVVDTSSCHDCPSVSNPFLEPEESSLLTSLKVPMPDADNAASNSTAIREPYSTLGSFIVSARLVPGQQKPPPPPEPPRYHNHLSASSLEPSCPQSLSKGNLAPPVSELDSIAALPSHLAGGDGALSAAPVSSDLASVTTGAATARTPGGATLVNPFSKSAQHSGCHLNANNVSSSGGCVLSGGTSLTGSFAGGAARRKSRRSMAPCFAIFVGGATLPPGVQSSNSSDRRGFPCIAVCFNPSSRSPLVTNSGRSPSASSCSASVRATSLCGSNRASTSPVPRPLGTGTLGCSIGICVSFCSVTEALTARGSLVDRKGIRGTEYGRHYVRSLTDAVLPYALHADTWVAKDEATGMEVARVMEALKGCVPAPLGGVVELMLLDALPQKAGDNFVWKENGGRRLAELLTEAAETEARRRESTAGSKSHTVNVTAAAGATSGARSNDALMSMSPLNSVTGAVACDPKERSAALRRVEDLLCTGQRVEAVEAALAAHLYVHALLISMMCPAKDLYLRSVQAVMQQELLITSPLAHAYSLFNEMPLPPLALPPPRANEEAVEGAAAGEGRGMPEAAQQPQPQSKRHQEIFLRDQAMLQQTWRRHAAVLLANFTRHSGDGLLQLAMTLEQLHLVVEAHTCLLLLHLTPLGTAGPARAGAEPLPPASSLTPEDVEDLLPRPDQRQIMGEIQRHIGIVGGMYHPTQGCRASFLTPVKTLLTQLVHLVSALLDARAPPLLLPESADPPVPFHGLPHGQPQSDVGYRMMQVLWLRELGLGTEAGQALHALLQRMPPPMAFSLRTPPRTLNELVYLFGGVPPPSPPLPPDAADTATAASRGEPASQRETATQQPSPFTSAEPSSHSREKLQQAADNAAGEVPNTAISPSMPATSEEHHMGPSPPQNPQQRPTGAPQLPLSLNGAPPPSSSPGTAATQLTRDERAAALHPPEQPAPSKVTSLHQLQAQRQSLPPPQLAAPTTAGNAGAKAAQAPAASKLKQPAPRRARSLDALRNFLFRRGNSEAAGEEKTNEAKPMHLDTEKPPTFDSVTGRWLFEETEEERRLRELAKAGPPKMAPKAGAPTAPAGAAGLTSAAAPGPAPLEAALLQQPAPGTARQPGPGRAGPGAPAPTHTGGGVPTPRPAGGVHAVVGRNVLQPTMAGRGAARPRGRLQYVDMFNSIG